MRVKPVSLRMTNVKVPQDNKARKQELPETTILSRGEKVGGYSFTFMLHVGLIGLIIINVILYSC